MKSCHCDNTDGPQDANGNKSCRLRNIKYDLTFMWNLKDKSNPQIQGTDGDCQRQG